MSDAFPPGAVSGEPVNPEESDSGGGVSRRHVLAGGAGAGLAAIVLPSAASAASAGVESEPAVQLSAPTGVSGTPIGYPGSSTGAIRVSWSAVTGATSYQVAYSTSPSGPFSVLENTVNTSGTETTLDLTGLSGTATTYYFVVRTNSNGTLSADSSVANSSNVIATGGTVTSTVDGSTTYVRHSFASTGEATFALNTTSDVEYLIVGGGGGGGSGRDTSSGGGGGAGMVRTGTASSLALGNYSVIVGGGGAGGTSVTGVGNDVAAGTGESSSFDAIISLGGGGGKHSREFTEDGVSVHGKGGYAQVGTTTAATGGWGGQNVTLTTGGSGGGGGGAGGVGGAGTGSSNAPIAGGAGGAGVSSSITGSLLEYGVGGAGAKGNTQVVGAAGTNGRGNGGGAGSWSSSGAGSGGTGGSGVVILRYALPTS